MLNTFLTEVLLIAGLGAFLDSVFINKEERQKIEAYLESGPRDLTLNVRFSRFLERAHSIIFGRFFSGKLLSFSFILSAASISIASFSTVIGLQIYFFPEQFSQIRFDATQFAIFAAFIAFNILFDYAVIPPESKGLRK